MVQTRVPSVCATRILIKKLFFKMLSNKIKTCSPFFLPSRTSSCTGGRQATPFSFSLGPNKRENSVLQLDKKRHACSSTTLFYMVGGGGSGELNDTKKRPSATLACATRRGRAEGGGEAHLENFITLRVNSLKRTHKTREQRWKGSLRLRPAYQPVRSAGSK